MKMTVRDIADAMTTSHEGFAGLVCDSIAFSLARELTDEEQAQIYNITERAVSDAVCRLEVVSECEDKALTPSQFCDLADYLYSYGVFSGPGGIQGNELCHSPSLMNRPMSLKAVKSTFATAIRLRCMTLTQAIRSCVPE